jgi:hypothetical protein
MCRSDVVIANRHYIIYWTAQVKSIPILENWNQKRKTSNRRCPPHKCLAANSGISSQPPSSVVTRFLLFFEFQHQSKTCLRELKFFTWYTVTMSPSVHLFRHIQTSQVIVSLKKSMKVCSCAVLWHFPTVPDSRNLIIPSGQCIKATRHCNTTRSPEKGFMATNGFS